tara:strand:+ start:83 stop:361 length:279 start_codon:yes stop_codon:yes gene_type:complete
MKNKMIEDRSAIHDDCMAIFDTAPGRRVLKHLIKTQYVIEPIYNAGQSCCDTANRDGKRSVVLALIKFINKDPSYFHTLMEEIEQEIIYGNG